jgi:hypothetical protein
MNKHVITYLSSKWKGTLHINGYKLYSSSRRLIPLCIRGRLQKELFNKGEKKLARLFHFTCSYIEDFHD